MTQLLMRLLLNEKRANASNFMPRPPGPMSRGPAPAGPKVEKPQYRDLLYRPHRDGVPTFRRPTYDPKRDGTLRDNIQLL